MEENYYYSDDFSAEFYIKAAKCGFITTSMYKNKKFILLPEIQFNYAILDFDNIKISKKIEKLLKTKNYHFVVSNQLNEVCKRIKSYHKDSWLNDDYISILNRINNKVDDEFKLLSVELRQKDTNRLISGELGYKIGKVYTSLTGFTTREKIYNNWGKLQLVLLNNYLKENAYSFWNLGHPQLKYKIDLGAKIYKRKTFLERLKKEK